MPAHNKKANRNQGRKLVRDAYRQYDAGHLEAALALLKHARTLGYQPPVALREQAKILLRLHRDREALSVIHQAIQADPRHPLGYGLKGVIMIHLGEYDAALAQHDLAIKHAPEELLAEFYRQKSDLLWQLERFEEALQASDEAIARNPTDARAYATKGHSLLALERYEEALAAYRQALTLNPKMVTVYMGMEYILKKLGLVYDAAQIRAYYENLN